MTLIRSVKNCRRDHGLPRQTQSILNILAYVCYIPVGEDLRPKNRFRPLFRFRWRQCPKYMSHGIYTVVQGVLQEALVRT